MHATGGGTRTHGYAPLRIGHLVPDASNGVGHLEADPTSHNHEVGLSGLKPHGFAAKPGHVVFGGRKRHHLDGATRQPELKRPQ
jgi:hypothetical protein